MATGDLIAMARPFWFMPVQEAAPRAASTLLQTYTTPMQHRDITANLQWAHLGRRDLAQYILQRMSEDSREGRTADEMMRSLWWFISNMQH